MTQQTNNHSFEKVVVHVDSDIEELIPGFLANRQDDIKSILGALEQNDYETVKILGHSMKGAGGGYGFDEITEIGRFLELAAKEGDAQEIKLKTNDLSDYLERIEIVFDE